MGGLLCLWCWFIPIIATQGLLCKKEEEHWEGPHKNLHVVTPILAGLGLLLSTHITFRIYRCFACVTDCYNSCMSRMRFGTQMRAAKAELLVSEADMLMLAHPRVDLNPTSYTGSASVGTASPLHSDVEAGGGAPDFVQEARHEAMHELAQGEAQMLQLILDFHDGRSAQQLLRILQQLRECVQGNVALHTRSNREDLQRMADQKRESAAQLWTRPVAQVRGKGA